jgi:hypothetical protein
MRRRPLPDDLLLRLELQDMTLCFLARRRPSGSDREQQRVAAGQKLGIAYPADVTRPLITCAPSRIEFCYALLENK